MEGARPTSSITIFSFCTIFDDAFGRMEPRPDDLPPRHLRSARQFPLWLSARGLLRWCQACAAELLLEVLAHSLLAAMQVGDVRLAWKSSPIPIIGSGSGEINLA
jgi:hypothetical protein